MWDKLKNDKYVKDLLVKLITVLVIAAIALILVDVLSQDKDGRRQIVDMDGGTEVTDTLATTEEIRLESILSQLEGVGDADVMITYQYEEEADAVFTNQNNDRKVAGVIVVCEGAGNVVIKNDIINAVATVYDISASKVVVMKKLFQRTNGNE